MLRSNVFVFASLRLCVKDLSKHFVLFIQLYLFCTCKFIHLFYKRKIFNDRGYFVNVVGENSVFFCKTNKFSNVIMCITYSSSRGEPKCSPQTVLLQIHDMQATFFFRGFFPPPTAFALMLVG